MSVTENLPEAFKLAVESISSVAFREELTVRQIDSPSGVAPYSYALAADVLIAEHEHESQHGTGRFILLYDPAEPESWGGPFRVVAFAQAPLEAEIGLDPFLANVAWSWLTDALTIREADYFNASGTATRILSTGFGELADSGEGAQIELRASWSPASPQMGEQAEAWGELLCMLAGLPPTADAVSLTARRRERG
ncbi:DUF3000 domain-containing protein [Aurantimicrobium minutum]|uniref:DUF3000 domain-containing protein n=1 Tax=Aurantimicrobium minutum TaxID=708131 RepID=UPI0024061DE7|nr:DUF3000 domain-containing protein [Aurantimicrobium minutum]MDF9809968.1 hypothetical protein [Aurantimicrobium minutum]MDH6207820.1 hypothetical protein [Aurantimicrobium minutum]MDH6255447.1 hypothetical protein [Aurantimicrobium minutum]MDH6409228.1 hypothetical protein [Aurantimicrobium minutum]MDH6424777.1 hypothetical protein [Aurantimicrobium minutum]